MNGIWMVFEWYFFIRADREALASSDRWNRQALFAQTRTRHIVDHLNMLDVTNAWARESSRCLLSRWSDSGRWSDGDIGARRNRFVRRVARHAMALSRDKHVRRLTQRGDIYMTTVFTGHKAAHWVDRDEFVPGLPVTQRWHGLKSKHPYGGKKAPFCSRSIQSSTCMCRVSLTGRKRLAQ